MAARRLPAMARMAARPRLLRPRRPLLLLLRSAAAALAVYALAFTPVGSFSVVTSWGGRPSVSVSEAGAGKGKGGAKAKAKAGQPKAVRKIKEDVALEKFARWSLKKSTREIAVDDPVKAQNPDDMVWYPGTVLFSDPRKERYVVEWDDPGDGPPSLEINHWNRIQKVAFFQDYQVGDKVRAIFPDDGQEYPGIVSGLEMFGNCRIKWDDPDDGPEESVVHAKNVRRPRVPIESLKVGQKLNGTAVNVRDFGAFFDVGAEGNGLMHKTKMTRNFVTDVFKLVQEGRDFEVFVIAVMGDKFELSFEKEIRGGAPKRIRGDYSTFSEVSPSEWLNATVTAIKSFGAFAMVTAPGGATAEGMVHASLIKDGFVNNVWEEVTEGQQIQVRVVDVDMTKGQMRLSMLKEKGPEDNQETYIETAERLVPFTEVRPQEWLNGTVISFQKRGAIVEVRNNDSVARGWLIPIFIEEGFKGKVEDRLEEGQEVQVRVKKIILAKRAMSLTMLPYRFVSSEWKAHKQGIDMRPFWEVPPQKWIKGRVNRVQSKNGAFITVTLDDGTSADGLLPHRLVGKDHGENIQDTLRAGDEVEVRIDHVDLLTKRITLSMLELEEL